MSGKSQDSRSPQLEPKICCSGAFPGAGYNDELNIIIGETGYEILYSVHTDNHIRTRSEVTRRPLG